LALAIKTFELRAEDFHAVIDGMEMDVLANIQAPDFATLDLYCDRVASAVGRLSVRIFGVPLAHGDALSHHLGRAFQLTNILRDIDEDALIDRLYLPKEALQAIGISSTLPQEIVGLASLDQVCAPVVARAERHFEQAYKIMDLCPRASVKAPRIMAMAYRGILETLIARGFSRPRERVSLSKPRLVLALLQYGLF
jgi:phytoene synthase